MLDDALEIPDGAVVTVDLDCVLLTSWPSYFSQLVRLAAAEKGLNWKHYNINHLACAHLEPWY